MREGRDEEERGDEDAHDERVHERAHEEERHRDERRREEVLARRVEPVRPLADEDGALLQGPSVSSSSRPRPQNRVTERVRRTSRNAGMPATLMKPRKATLKNETLRRSLSFEADQPR